MKLIKKIFVTTLIFVLAFTFTNIPILSSPSVAQAATIKLNHTKKTLDVGKTFTLKVTGTKKTVKWSTSNKKVATVSKGKVKAIAKGTAKITAAVAGKKLVCTVTVKKPVNPYLKDAPFKAKELNVLNFSLVVPEGWSLTTNSIAADGIVATLSSDDLSTLSNIVILVGISDEKVDYSEFQEEVITNITNDNLYLTLKTQAGSDDFELKDFTQNEITLGSLKVMKSQYNVTISGITFTQALYHFCIDKYKLQISTTDFGDTKELNLSEVSEYAIKSLVIN